nr:hypothetical protein [Bradyrhizobium elkanii]
MDDITPFANKPIRIDLAITCRQRERGYSSEAASNRHRNPGSKPKGRRLIKELTLRSISGERATGPSPAEKVAFDPGANDHGIELLISKMKVSAGPGFRVG